MTKALSLYQLNTLVADVISNTMAHTYWVEAELSEARESNGHCYMELIEKEEGGNVPIARASAKCWRNVWSMIKPYFMRITGQTIHAGMKVMLQVHAQFHPQYGFSWIVDDINPEFTMGDMMRKRQEIIRQLKAEGVFDLQHELRLPMFTQHIAVISSETAAGYGDFCNQLMNNEYGLFFHAKLFPAVMQGEQVEQSIISALDAINQQVEDYDCVVIIRGGGATADLSGFDTLLLAERVLDMVSFQRVKTPTAAAAFLIDSLAATLSRVESAQTAIIDGVKRKIERENMRLQHLSSHIPVLFSVVRTKQEARLERMIQQLISGIKESINRSNHHLELLSQRMELLDPTLLLKRGYSITLHNGKAIKSQEELKKGDIIVTRLANGEVESVIK